MKLHTVDSLRIDYDGKRPNQPLEPTAGRRTASLFVVNTRSFQAPLALASGGSAPSR
jgi:hypothetical protein